MTLKQLKEQIGAINPQGMYPLTNEKLKTYQQMAFDWLLKLCEPLNLLVPYQDQNVYRAVDDGWFLLKPTIATEDEHFIDIDERLDLAFSYIIVHFIGMNDIAMIKRSEAYRLVLEYANNVNELGYSKAKEVYEQESFITTVKFDCFGKFYDVKSSFVKMVVDCILCNSVCMRADENKQLEKYKLYLTGVVTPLDKERLKAVDTAVFNYLMTDMELIAKYSEEQLNSVTTRFNELCKFSEGEVVDNDIESLDRRLASPACCEEKMKGCIDD